MNEWSDEKLFYLRNYATIFSKGMKNKWANRAYLDLFAGPGRYRARPAGRFENGSPLIALGLPFTHYYFSDLSVDVFSALDQRVKRDSTEEQYVRVQRGDANELAGQLHDAVRGLGPNTLSLAFIDPPGTQFRFESIRRLSEGLPMDLLINFLSPPTSRGPSTTEITGIPGTTRWRAGGRLPVSRRAAA